MGAFAQPDGLERHDGVGFAALRTCGNWPGRVVDSLDAEHNRVLSGEAELDPNALLRQHSVHDPAPVAAGADVVVLQRRRRLVRASRLLAVDTLRGERRSVVRLDARADGSGAVDEPSCPRHGSFQPFGEIGIVIAKTRRHE